MRRQFEVFGKESFERLARLSNGHLYNLRQSQTYQRRRSTFTKTRPTQVAIGERRKPDPNGRPGFLRVDTVHQGDRDSAKGLYHINIVDQVMASCCSEAFWTVNLRARTGNSFSLWRSLLSLDC